MATWKNLMDRVESLDDEIVREAPKTKGKGKKRKARKKKKKKHSEQEVTLSDYGVIERRNSLKP